MTSRYARTPPGSSTWSVVTENTGPRYVTREDNSRAFGALRCVDFFLEEEAEDFAMQTI